jgi:hypothetical protein
MVANQPAILVGKYRAVVGAGLTLKLGLATGFASVAGLLGIAPGLLKAFGTTLCSLTRSAGGIGSVATGSIGFTLSVGWFIAKVLAWAVAAGAVIATFPWGAWRIRAVATRGVGFLFTIAGFIAIRPCGAIAPPCSVLLAWAVAAGAVVTTFPWRAWRIRAVATRGVGLALACWAAEFLARAVAAGAVRLT